MLEKFKRVLKETNNDMTKNSELKGLLVAGATGIAVVLVGILSRTIALIAYNGVPLPFFVLLFWIVATLAVMVGVGAYTITFTKNFLEDREPTGL